MIESIKINNFKSIASPQEVNFSKFTVLVGNNGVGKSNLINCISLLKDLASGQPIDDAIDKFVLTPAELLNRNSVSGDSEISMKLKNGTEQTYNYSITIGADRESGVIDLVVKHEQLDLCVGNSCEKVYERNGDKMYDSAGERIPLELPSDIAAMSRYESSDLRNVKKLLSKTFVPILEVTELVKKVQDLVYRLTKVPEQYSEFMSMTQKLLPALQTFEKIEFPSDDPFSTEEDDYMVLLTEKNMKGRLSFKAISHGDIRTLYYLAAGVMSDDYSTFVFDEVENGIHPDRICKIIEFLSNIASGSNKQFIFSTHSTKMINYVRPQEVIYVYKGEGGTQFKELDSAEEISSVTKVLDKGGDLSEYLKARF